MFEQKLMQITASCASSILIGFSLWVSAVSHEAIAQDLGTTVVEERNAKGTLLARYSVTTLLSGEKVRNGPFETFFANGKTATKGSYALGELDGDFVQRDGNGRIIASGHYDHGFRTGEWQFFNSGGRLIAASSGTYSITSVQNLAGKTIAKGSNLAGRRMGPWRVYYPDGKPAVDLDIRSDGSIELPRVTLWNGTIDEELVSPNPDAQPPVIETAVDYALVPTISPSSQSSLEAQFAVRAALKAIRETKKRPSDADAILNKNRVLALSEGLNDALLMLRSPDPKRFETAANWIRTEMSSRASHLDFGTPQTQVETNRPAFDRAFLRWYALAHLMFLEELRVRVEQSLTLHYGIGAGSLSQSTPGHSRLALGESTAFQLAPRSGLFLHRNGNVRVAERAVDWLLRHQSPDGRFAAAEFSDQCATNRCTGEGDPLWDVVTTSLSISAILGDSRNQTTLDPATAMALGRALRWLLMFQKEDGSFVGIDPLRNLYDPFGVTKSTSLAIRALAESSVAFHSAVLRDAALRAVKYLLALRNPYKAWRFHCPPNGENDTECTGHAVAALAAASEIGLKNIDEDLKGGLLFLDEMTDPGNGRTGYMTRGGLSPREAGLAERWPSEKTEWMTAVALYSRYLIGNPDETACDISAGVLLRQLPMWDESAGTIDLQYWYHGTQAMFARCGHGPRNAESAKRGRDWERWNDKVRDALCKNQEVQGDEAGSWNPVYDPYGHRGGRVYATAIGALTLQVELGQPPGGMLPPASVTR